MDIIKIGYADKEYVSHLAPKSMLNELNLKNQYALALGIESKTDKSNVIIGLVCFYINTINKDDMCLILRWFYILPEYREKGYGHVLFDKVCELAVKNGISQIKVTYPDLEDTEPYKYLFYEMDFAYKKAGVAEVYTTLEEIGSKVPILEKLQTNKDAVPLSEVSKQQFKKFYMSLPIERKNKEEYWLPLNTQFYDTETSFVMLNSDKDIDAVLLIRNINEAMEPFLAFTNGSQSNESFFKLFSNVYHKSVEKYGKDYSVRLRASDPKKVEFYEKLFSDFAFCPSIQGSMKLE